MGRWGLPQVNFMHGTVVKVGTKALIDDELVSQRLGAPSKPLLFIRNDMASHGNEGVVLYPASCRVD